MEYFASTAAFCWADKKHWFTDKCIMPWDVFLPCCLSSFNECQKKLLKTVLLLLDVVTFEPRKPVPLGTMLKNGIQCFTGCFVNQDVVLLKEQQQALEIRFWTHLTTRMDLTVTPDLSVQPMVTQSVLLLARKEASTMQNIHMCQLHLR
jgi:hypothetical protein